MSRKKKNPADLSHRTLFFFKKIDLWLAATCFPPVFPENPTIAASKSCLRWCRCERLLLQIRLSYRSAMVVCGNGLNRVKSHVERCGFKRRLSVAVWVGKLRFKTGACKATMCSHAQQPASTKRTGNRSINRIVKDQKADKSGFLIASG